MTEDGQFERLLRGEIHHAIEQVRQHQEAEDQRQLKIQDNLRRIEGVVARRFTNAAQAEGEYLRSDNNGDRKSQHWTLTWIGPGDERALGVTIDHEQGLLAWEWETHWDDPQGGIQEHLELPGRLEDFTDAKVDDLIVQLVRPAPWLRRQFPDGKPATSR